MDETLIRGIFQGALFMLIGLTAYGIWKLIKSPTEGARRVRWVVVGAAALFVLAIIGSHGGVSAVAISLVILGIIVWVYRGFRKSKN